MTSEYFFLLSVSCINSPTHIATPWLAWEAVRACVCFAGLVYNFFLSRCKVCKRHFWRAKYRHGFQGRLGLTMFESVKSGTQKGEKRFVIVTYRGSGCILFCHSRIQQHLFRWHHFIQSKNNFKQKDCIINVIESSWVVSLPPSVQWVVSWGDCFDYYGVVLWLQLTVGC